MKIRSILNHFLFPLFVFLHITLPGCSYEKILSLSGNHLDDGLMQKLIDCFHVDVLVESGTAWGDTVEIGRKRFNQVYTCELGHSLYSDALNRFKMANNVFCYQGDSSGIFRKIIPSIEGRILFWLDAHYCGGKTVKGSSNSGIRNEIAAIKESGLKNAIILVDDIRDFQGYPEDVAWFGGYPSVHELKNLILEINNDYEFWIIGDMAIAFPSADQVKVSKLVVACTQSRFCERANNFQCDEPFVELEDILINLSYVPEANVIDLLYQTYVEPGDIHPSYHYSLWKGLIELGRKNFAFASQCFDKAIAAGFSSWRLDLYNAKAKIGMGDFKGAKKSLLLTLQSKPELSEAKELYALISPYITQNYVTVCSEGNQLGGQMTTYAVILGYAWTHGLTPVFSKDMLVSRPGGPLNYEYVFSKLPLELPANVSNTPPTHFYHYAERDALPYTQGNICICNQPTYPLQYFHPFRDKIREIYSPSEELVQKLRGKYASIMDHPKTVAVHIRTYHPSYDQHLCLGANYYESAMSNFSDDHLFVIFSDRIEWCKANLNLKNKNAVFIEGNSHVFDLYLMTFCKNIITANSTFSWWAAYLRRDENGKVYVPSKWFPVTTPEYWRTFYPPEYIILPVEIPPPDWNLINYPSTSIYE